MEQSALTAVQEEASGIVGLLAGKGSSALQSRKAEQQIGRRWVVNMDLEKFFLISKAKEPWAKVVEWRDDRKRALGL